MSYTGDGFILGILVMAAVTYLLRVAPLLLWERLRVGERLRLTLARVPPIVFTAVIVATLAPYVLPGPGTAARHERIAAFLAAMLVQYRYRSTLLAILAGLAVAAGAPAVLAAWRALR